MQRRTGPAAGPFFCADKAQRLPSLVILSERQRVEGSFPQRRTLPGAAGARGDDAGAGRMTEGLYRIPRATKGRPYGGGRDGGGSVSPRPSVRTGAPPLTQGGRGVASGGLVGAGPLDGPAGQCCFQENEGRIRALRDADPSFVRVSWQGGTAGCRGRQPLQRRTDSGAGSRARPEAPLRRRAGRRRICIPPPQCAHWGTPLDARGAGRRPPIPHEADDGRG